ncbi:MAG: branched-chain amino acid ABC transporter ATP-binding protein/permease [Actinobacteria bacterium]|nr:branched-chain amino acid ABC transporter ATP-binding protein/permease [Actinomycetota bacterium]
MTRRGATFASVAIPLALVAVLALLPGMVGAYETHLLILTLLAIGLAVSYRPLLLAHQVSLAHGALYAIGAYGFAILGVDHGVSFWLAIAAGGVFAVAASIVIGIPSLRTSDAYFLLITFAFSVVVISLIQNTESLTGGFAGIAGIPYPPGVKTEDDFFYLSLVVVAVTVAVFILLDRSRWGLELRGIGSSSDLAESIGIGRTGALLLAFAIGALFAGILGGIYASFIGFIAPQSFSLWLSVSILTSVIVGGVRYVWGGVIGAAFITLVPLLFNFGGSWEAIFGAVSVIVVLFAMRHGIVTELVAYCRRRFGSAPTASVPVGGALGNLDGGPIPTRLPIGANHVLEVRGIAKSFGGVHAVRGVSFQLCAGETLGLIGPNGSGKTTTFDLISGFRRPDGGEVKVNGAALAHSPHRVVRGGLARTFQATSVFTGMTVFENVLLAAGAHTRRNPLRRLLLPVRRSRRERRIAEGILDELGLAASAGALAEDLPYGHKKVLGIAIALATDPDVICLDEPATGMTEAEIAHLIAVLEHLRSTRQIAIIVIEHRLAVIRTLCDRVVALRAGEVISEGDAETVLDSPEVAEAFLGGSAE